MDESEHDSESSEDSTVEEQETSTEKRSGVTVERLREALAKPVEPVEDDPPHRTSSAISRRTGSRSPYYGIDTAALLGGFNTDDLFGTKKMFADFQRSIFPSIDHILDTLPSRQIISQITGEALLGFQATTRAPIASIIGGLVSQPMSDIIEGIQAQQRAYYKSLLPVFDTADLFPALSSLTSVIDTERRIVANSLIQQVVSQPLIDVSALVSINPTQQMLSDILSAADLTRSINLDTMLPSAFGFPSLNLFANAVTAAQRIGVPIEDDEDEAAFDEAALEAVLAVLDEDIDPDAPPVGEQLSSLRALGRLCLALRPNLREEPAFGWVTAGTLAMSAVAVMAHIARYHPGLFEVFMYVSGFGSTGTFVYGTTKLFLPRRVDKSKDESDD